jgi:hypothetical protein
MGLRTVIAHLLAHLEPLEPGDHGFTEYEAHDECGQDGAGAPKGNVFENVKTAEYVMERI